MAFCTNCGQPLNENGQCAACGAGAAPQQQAPNYQQPQQNYQPPQQDYQQQGYQQPPQGGYYPQQGPTMQQRFQSAAGSPIGTSIGNIFKKFFSSDPLRTFDNLNNEPNILWTIFGGAYVLLWALTIMLVPANLIKDMVGSFAMSYIKLPYGTFFLWGLLIGLISFFGFAGLFKLIHVICKQPVPFTKVMNMVGIAQLVTSLAMAAGIIISFLLPSVGLFIIMIASFMGFIMMYSGLQKLAVFKTPPVWLFIAAYAVYTLVICLIVNGLVSAETASLGNYLF